MTLKKSRLALIAGAALTLMTPAGALAQVAPPTLPPPFANAPMNDDPRAGQFSLTFDDRGQLIKVGRAAIGSSTINYPVFYLPASTRPAGDAGSSNARLIQRSAPRVRRTTPSQ